MKKILIKLLVVLLLLNSVFACAVPVLAAKTEKKRSIAIVFDNSGTMYFGENAQAWCRATYATEVFASMLNEGDRLLIYPMNPISVKGKTYTMESPLIITDPSQASQIREIYTEDASGTPIESIDAAAKGIAAEQADEKYMIILTDGTEFYENGDNDENKLTKEQTVEKLTERINKLVGPELNVLYLGIGSGVAMPKVDSDYFLGEQASNSKNVISELTKMCNRIFARDTLPSSHINGETIDFDISLSKLIVFVQGENVADVKITGKNGGSATLVSSTKTQYSTMGAGNYKGKNQSVVDTTLQGMLVIYTDCSVGEYDISYTGKASNIEVYYEPDADLDFVFTDAEGNLVEPDSLYKGDYKVQYGLKDAKTGELISSDLLGNPSYLGKYVLNGKEYPIEFKGQSGETPVSLDVGDEFTAELTASYLNGYSITKTAKDFNWPDGRITVAPIPVGDLKLEISNSDKVFDLKDLEKGNPYTAKVFYQGTQLTGDELKKVTLKWEAEKSNAEIKQEFKDDHFDLTLHYKDNSKPLETKCGKCTVSIAAFYTADGSTEANCKAALTYTIEDRVVVPEIVLSAPQKYFVISSIDNGESIKATVTSKGKKLTKEELSLLEFTADCEGIGLTVNPLPEESAFEIKLNSKGKMEKGKYKLQVAVAQKDSLGRNLSAEESCKIELSAYPLWSIWLFWIVLLLIIFFILRAIAHIKCLPKVYVMRKNCSLIVANEEVEFPKYNVKIENGQLIAEAAKGTDRFGIRMSVSPGTDSYLITKQAKRKMKVDYSSVAASLGSIHTANIANKPFEFNDENNKLEMNQPKPMDFEMKNGSFVKYGGKVFIDGTEEVFEVVIKIGYGKEKK